MLPKLKRTEQLHSKFNEKQKAETIITNGSKVVSTVTNNKSK